MTPTLYFLRSSENKIVNDMLKYAHPNLSNPEIYSQFYGLSTKDLGLYALIDNKIAGAIWCRKLKEEDGAEAFIDAETPIVSFAVLPEFRKKGVGKAMMQQFLLEAGTSYEGLSIKSPLTKETQDFLKDFGFQPLKKDSTILFKELEKKELIRPSDGYDARKWMD